MIKYHLSLIKKTQIKKFRDLLRERLLFYRKIMRVSIKVMIKGALRGVQLLQKG